LAPVKMRRRPKTMFDRTAVSRTTRPIPAVRSPSPVHEKAATAVTRTIGPKAPAGTSTSRIAPPTTNANADTSQPFRITGRARPR
jgi:hypothetical protein